MQEAISAYRARLDKALVAHQLISDMNDVDEIVVEKKNFDVQRRFQAELDEVSEVRPQPANDG